jgi:hypothetical protein
LSFEISGDAISITMDSRAASYEGHAPAEEGFCINKNKWAARQS